MKISLAFVLAVVLGACSGGSTPPSPDETTPPINGTTATATATAAATTTSTSVPDGVSGCSDVQALTAYDPASEDQQHNAGDVGPPLDTYASVPPASGPHAQVPLPAGVYDTPPDVYRSIHSLEHGAAIIWFRPRTFSDAELSTLAGLAAGSDGMDHLILAPFEYPELGPGGVLPEGVNISMVAWHRLQACEGIDPAAIGNFRMHYRFPTPDAAAYLGEAPEIGAAI